MRTIGDKKGCLAVKRVLIVCPSGCNPKMLPSLTAQMRQHYTDVCFSVLLSNADYLPGLKRQGFVQVFLAKGIINKIVKMRNIEFEAIVLIPDGSWQNKLLKLFIFLARRNTTVFYFSFGERLEKVDMLQTARARINPLDAYQTYRGKRYLRRCATDRRGLQWFYQKYLDGSYANLQEKEKLILDVGCAEGRIVSLLAQDKLRLIGLDLKPCANWQQISGAKFLLANAQVLPFVESSFDLCLLIQSLEYIQDDVQALKEVNRVLKPKARLILQVANKASLYPLWTGRKADPRYCHHYSLPELKKMLGQIGFTIERLTTDGVRIPFLTAILFGLFPYPFPRLYPDMILENLVPAKNRATITVCCVKE